MSNRLPPYKATELPRLSSEFDASYSRSALQDRIKGDPAAPDPINREDWYDGLSPAVTEMFNESQTLDYYNADSAEPITTITSKKTGSTTAWWAIIMYNGFVHQDEIPSGVRLRIPDVRAVVTAFQRLKSVRGKPQVF